MATRYDRGLRLVATLALATATLVACGGDSGDDSGAASSTSGTVATSTAPTTASSRNAEPITIKTRMYGFAGEVLARSTLGDGPFCPGGSVTHEHGSLDLGYPAVNVIDCSDGQLRIGFGPGPDQMNNAVQTSDWEVLDGSGLFAGTSGSGRMEVRWESVGSDQGQETFTGTVALP